MSLGVNSSKYDGRGDNVLLARGRFVKLDTPLTTDLGLGVKRRIIEASDSIVEIPSKLQPITELISPLQQASLSTTPMNSSFLVEYITSKNNAAAFTDDIVTLAPGLWDVRLTISWAYTIATALGIGQRIRIQLQDPVFTTGLAFIPLTPNTAQFWMTQTRHKFLSRNQTLLQANGPLTAVGDTIEIWIGLIGLKIL